MKHKFTPILLAALLGSAGIASAVDPVTIYITSSNGDRGPTQTAIAKILTSNGSWTYNGINGFSNGVINSTVTGSNFGAFNGIIGTTPVIIKTSYSGALAALAAVAGNLDQNYVTSNGTNDGTVANPISGAHVTAKADFGLSTNFQSTSPYNGTFQSVNYVGLTEEIVGVSPIGFYASPGFPGTNITTQQAQLLYTTGVQPLSLFTGNAADADKTVWALGRNVDAGQRFGVYTEIGLGTTATVTDWFPTVTGATTANNVTFGGTANSHVLWPVAEQAGSFPVIKGNGGFQTGALLAEKLTVTLGPDAYKGGFYNPDNGGTPGTINDYQFPNATAGYYIGYVTTGDAATRVLGSPVTVGNQGVPLTYNGVALHNPDKSVNTDNIKNGKYTLWVYNRVIRTSALAADTFKTNFANALRDQIKNTDAVVGGGLIETTLNVYRTVDGGLVNPR